MKVLSLCVLVLFVVSKAMAQTIYRVNNNPGVTGVNVYNSAQAAHDAATANDIMVIEPSDIDYGTLTLTKPLKIYGNGYFLNYNNGLRVDDRSSRFFALNLDTGSDGTEIYGIEITGEEGELNLYGVSNITIERCHLVEIDLNNQNSQGTISRDVSNIVIRANHIEWISADDNFDGSIITNVLVLNNIMEDLEALQVYGWVVRHNTIMEDVYLSNSLFENNICLNPEYFEVDNVTLSYNVSSKDSFHGGLGNQNSAALTNEFVGTGSEDARWMIKPSSFLKTAGNSGQEVGAFGGQRPYVISGILALPSISEISIPAAGSNDLPLQVTTSVNSNN